MPIRSPGEPCKSKASRVWQIHTAERRGFVGRNVAGDNALEIETSGLIGVRAEDQFAILHPHVLAVLIAKPGASDVGPEGSLALFAGDKARGAIAVNFNVVEALVGPHPEVA